MDALRRRRLAQAVEFNVRRLLAFQTRAPGGEHRRRHGAEWGLTSVPSPQYNCVVAASFPAGDAQERVRRVVADLRAKRSSFGWDVGPSTSPPRLGVCLARAGFYHKLDITAMAVPLRGFARPALPPGVRIERLDSRTALGPWAMALARSFGDPPREARAVARLEGALGLSTRSPRLLFAAYSGRRMVGTALLFVAARTAGVYNVGVLRPFRGKGIGAALTAAALEDGRRRGCTLGTLYASRMGAGLYRRLGFDKVGVTQVWIYETRKAPRVKGP